MGLGLHESPSLVQSTDQIEVCAMIFREAWTGTGQGLGSGSGPGLGMTMWA